jgi:ubiquinone/menaquinone biosynthesis C-methylase UbiE
MDDEKHLQNIINKLDKRHRETVLSQIEYFSKKEADNRDKIIIGYFGDRGIMNIVNIVVETIKPYITMENTTILDVGAGTGFFTIKIAEKIWRIQPKASIYALDITPQMLKNIEKKNSRITTILGLAENIEESIKINRKKTIPRKYNAIFSILTLHHCKDIDKVFMSMGKVLQRDGIIVIIDLVKHNYTEFRKEMVDIHLGFTPTEIKHIANKYFLETNIEVIPGLRCTDTGRSVELFKLTLSKYRVKN